MIPTTRTSATFDVLIRKVNAPNTDQYKIDYSIGDKLIHAVLVSEAEAQLLLDSLE